MQTINIMLKNNNNDNRLHIGKQLL